MKMTQKELTEYNLGQSLDDLMNLDPRGYGVCKILYEAARKTAGEPVSLHAAKALCKNLKKGDYVYLLTGFVLYPFACAETDGIIGTMFLAKTLQAALGVRPVIVCQEENVPAVKGLSRLFGLHAFPSVEQMNDLPFSLAYYPFTKDEKEAPLQAEKMMNVCRPAMVITVEAPGANEKGAYHNAVGRNITALEAKEDILFRKLQAIGVPSLSIGDLGNEIGLGTIGSQLEKYIPYAAAGECGCGCGGGIAVATKADNVLTATTSDWGCYAVCAMLAYLMGDEELMHDADLQERAMRRAADCGMIDMYGQTIPAIDGIGIELNRSVVTCMRECVKYSIALEKKCKTWFDKTLEKGYFIEKREKEYERV